MSHNNTSIGSFLILTIIGLFIYFIVKILDSLENHKYSKLDNNYTIAINDIIGMQNVTAEVTYRGHAEGTWDINKIYYSNAQHLDIWDTLSDSQKISINSSIRAYFSNLRYK